MNAANIRFCVESGELPAVPSPLTRLFRRLGIERTPPKPFGDFVECPTCAAKPGSPALCGPCLHNRSLIYELRRELGVDR